MLVTSSEIRRSKGEASFTYSFAHDFEKPVNIFIQRVEDIVAYLSYMLKGNLDFFNVRYRKSRRDKIS